MPKMVLSPNRLGRLLRPQGFLLRESSTLTKTIGFVRPSSIARLYEHLIVHGQGKSGEAVYATTAISGSPSQWNDECIAERDQTLLYALETDSERHWTLVHTREEAETWERRLAQHADFHSRSTATSKGPALLERLHQAFAAVDGYIHKLGDVKSVFDAEFLYFSRAAEQHRRDAERLASLIRSAGEWQDIQLACLILFQFASEVEGPANIFPTAKWHETPSLRARIYLLTDFLHEQRMQYSGGPGRLT